MAIGIGRLVIPQEDNHPDYAYDKRSNMVAPRRLATDDKLTDEKDQK
jgi:hypothetical protein